MSNTIYNKVTFNDRTLIDLSQDTVTSAEHIVSGHTGHLADGTQVTGTAETGGISIDDIATNTQPSGAIVLGSGINAIAIDAFTRKPITSLTFNGASAIGDRAFQGCARLKSVTAPNCSSVGANAFNGCTALETVSVPSCIRTWTNAFYNCTSLTTVDISSCTTIANVTFSGCTSLKNITLPETAFTIGNSAFYNCSSLKNCDFSNVNVISSQAFRNASVDGCSFNPVTIHDAGFRDTMNLNVGFFPRLTTMDGSYNIAGCYVATRGSNVTTLVFPVLTTIGGTYSLSYEYLVTAIDIGNLTSIPQYTFRVNSAMTTLILRKTSVTTLSNVNAFQETPFANGGTGGTIYVPSALIDSYKTATNWSTLDGYGTVTWAAIEGSQYENYYADGTAIS